MGAMITIGNESLETDENGEAIFYLEEGEINFTVIYLDIALSDIYTVTSGEDQIVDIEFLITSLNEENPLNPQIYPNPIREKITIITKQEYSMIIRDLSGEIIHQ